jgi:Protein of unknown function (DUF3754)
MAIEEEFGTERVTAAPERDHVIPLRRADILDALIEYGRITSAAERDQFRLLCRMFAAICHYGYFELLEKLRHAYFYFDPEINGRPVFPPATIEQAYAELVAALLTVLEDANFVELSREEVERAHREFAVLPVATETPLDDFREVRFFRRGHHHETLRISRWFGLRHQKIDAVIYDDVVLFAAVGTEAEILSKLERNRLSKRNIRPGSILIKYFRDIALADLNALYPNARVVMTLLDKLLLAVPAIAGGIPILLKLSTTVTVLFVVAGFYLGVSAAVGDSEMKAALAALSGLLALGGFIGRQWVKYQRQSLRHQMQITERLYYRNINNNAGIFDYLVGAAEDQECKEAFLAYYFLSTADVPPTKAELEGRIERWLKETFLVDVEFAVDNALPMLDRLGLLRRRDDAGLTVLPPAEALLRLDEAWASFFPRNKAGAAASSPPLATNVG